MHKALLASISLRGIIEDESADEINTVKRKYIENKIKEAYAPYVRDVNKIVYYCESINGFKTRLPKALLRDGEPIPQSARTEDELLAKIYLYLYGEEYDKLLKYSDSVSKWFERWIKEKKEADDLTSVSIDIYTQDFNKHVRNHPISNMRLCDLDSPTLLRFYKEICKGRVLDRKILGAVKTIFNGIFDLAIAEGVSTVNYARSVSTRNIKCKVVNNRFNAYSDEEREKILNYLNTIDDTFYSLGVALMFCLDIRIGELRALKWSDYDEAREKLNIARQIVRRRGVDRKEHETVIEYTKGEDDCDREEMIFGRAKDILTRLKRLNPDGEYMFRGRFGGFMRTNAFNNNLKRYCEAVGIPYRSSHKIRFWSITAQARAGVSLPSIMYNSGHKNKSTTLHYIRVVDTEKENAEKLGNIYT